MYSAANLAQRHSATMWMGSNDALGLEILDIKNTWASAVYTANLGVYVPFVLSAPATVAKVWWYNGTVVSGSTDVGVYDVAGTTKIIASGAQTNSGTSVLQIIDVTDTALGIGRYWLALTCDNATQTFFRMNSGVQYLDAIGVKQQASAYSSGLPSSISLSTPTVGYVPEFGFATRAAF